MVAQATLGEDRTRARKATKLARLLIVRGVVDVDTIAAYTEAERLELALVADVREPSDRTWSVVLGIVSALVELTAARS